MPDDLRVNSWLVIPAAELRERFSRSSGPGGQSVNTTDSRVELSFDVARSPSLPQREKTRALTRLDARLVDGVVTVAAETERSQLMNRDVARVRLAALLREAIAPRRRPASRPGPPRAPGSAAWPTSAAAPRPSATAATTQAAINSWSALVNGLQRERHRVDAPALVGWRREPFAGEHVPQVRVAPRAACLDPDHPERAVLD